MGKRRCSSAAFRGSSVLAALILVCVEILFCQEVGAAEWGKMKKCKDLGFCRRHRSRQIPSSETYWVKPDSISVVPRDEGHALSGYLLQPGQTGPKLRFIVESLHGGVFRFSIEDAGSTPYVRYSVPDVVSDAAGPRKLVEKDITVSELSTTLWSDIDDGASVSVEHSPFAVHLIAPGGSGEKIISFNAKGLLKFEKHRTRHSKAQDSTLRADSASVHEQAGPQGGAENLEEQDGDPVDAVDRDMLAEDVDEFDEDDNDSEYIGGDNIGDAEVPTPGSKEEDSAGLWEETFQSHKDPKLRGPESVGADITFPFATHLYGIPERTMDFSLPPTVLADGSPASEPYRMYNLDVFEFELDKPLGLYGAVPVMYGRSGSKVAAAMWLNSAETFVDVLGDDESLGKSSHWYSETGKVDVLLMPGPSAEHVYRQYMSITGAPAMPQRFALGYHQCRWNYRDDADARAVDAKFDEHDIPYDVLWLDIEHTDGKRYFTWDTGKFPDPTLLQNDLAARGRKMVTIIDPHIKRASGYAVHEAAEKNGFYVKTPEGNSYDGWCWPGSSSYYDFTSPEARSAWVDLFNPKDYPHFSEHLYTWVDMNEPSVFNGPEGTMPKHMVHAGGVEHRDVHNQYGQFVQRATYEGLLKGHGGNDRPFVLSRSFFPGSQKYGAIWTGDNTADWGHLRSSVSMLLPLQITGMVFSGADIGGFFGNPSPELLVRWYQAGAFQPFFRGHAHLDTNRREPWLFGEQNTALIAAAVRERYAYLPLWYTLMACNARALEAEFTAHASGALGPPMRPMWWEFPDDARLDAVQDQWMVGDSLLVAPVMTEGAAERVVLLPGSEPWYDLYDDVAPGRASQAAEQVVTVRTPMNRMVVFQRGGTIVPRQERRRRSSHAMASDPITLVVALARDGSATGELYMDDGRSFDFGKGAFALRKFEFKNGCLSASTVAGNATGFVGEDSMVERIVVYGYTGAFPTRAVVTDPGTNETQDTDVIAATPEKLVVRKPSVRAFSGTWTVELTT